MKSVTTNGGGSSISGAPALPEVAGSIPALPHSQTTTEGDITLLREYLRGNSIWGSPHAIEAFERLAELIDHYVPKVRR